MKERILFITGIIGSFSATIILVINQALTLLGVDTTGYVNIINIVGLILAIIILIGSVIFLNKYNVIQQKNVVNQNNLVTTALEGNATLMQTILPNLVQKVLDAAEERSNALLQGAEFKVNTMMNEMLPQLAEQTMRLVTEQSRDIVEQTTAKAQAVMTTMDELLPTYAKNISDSVAQTVRENNAHYHKMLTELKQVYNGNPPKLPEVVIPPVVVDTKALDAKLIELENIWTKTISNLSTLIIKPDYSITDDPNVILDAPAQIDLSEEVADLSEEVADLSEEVADLSEEVADLAEEVVKDLETEPTESIPFDEKSDESVTE